MGGLWVRLNGGAASGNFFAPTVLMDVDDPMLVAEEETFGPVAALMPFDAEVAPGAFWGTIGRGGALWLAEEDRR